GRQIPVARTGDGTGSAVGGVVAVAGGCHVGGGVLPCPAEGIDEDEHADQRENRDDPDADAGVAEVEPVGPLPLRAPVDAGRGAGMFGFGQRELLAARTPVARPVLNVLVTRTLGVIHLAQPLSAL